MRTEFLTYRTFDDGEEYVDEIIGRDIEDALTSVLEHDGPCRVLRIDYDAKGEIEASRNVTSDIIDLLKDAYGGGPAHPMIAEWADREEAAGIIEAAAWNRHCNAERVGAV